MTDRSFVAIALSGSALVVIGLLWTALYATKSPRSAHGADEGDGATPEQISALSEKLDRISLQIGSGGTGLAAGAKRARPQPAPGEIAAAYVDEPIPNDPTDRVWDAAPAAAVPLQRQDQTMPMLEKVSVPSVSVQALTNGRQIGWRLSWADASADYHLDTDRFCDAVGLQLPLKKNANYKMGDRGFPVYILQWKAIWQKDIDDGFQDVQDLHPNYWADLYWFAEGEFPYRVPQAFKRTESLDWFVGLRAGNPMAELYRREPVQEMVAEGFGTLTNQEATATSARGVWKDGRWSVTFVRPMVTNDPLDYQFEPGEKDTVAFAVWEGKSGNVGGRKNHSQWIVFEVQR